MSTKTFNTVLTTIWLIFLLSRLSAQEERMAYYDAISFAEMYHANKPQKIKFETDVLKNLQYYFGDGVDVEATFSSNPFLAKYFATSAPANMTTSSSLKDVPKGISSISGLDVTNLTEGLSQFMIKRAKEELTISFFNRFKKFTEEHPEIKALFPETTSILERLLSYQYPEMLPALRTGFYDDLKKLDYHIEDVLDLERYRDYPDLRIIVKSIQLVRSIETEEKGPADLISEFAELKEWSNLKISDPMKNLGAAARITDIFSQSLRYKDDSRTWISLDALNDLLDDPAAFEIYLGLIYQLIKQKDIKFFTKSDSIPAVNVLLPTPEKIADSRVYIVRFIELSDEFAKLNDNIAKKQRKAIELIYDDYFNYIDLSIDLVELGFNISELFEQEIDHDLFSYSCDLYRNLYRKEYSQAIINATNILNKIYDNSLKRGDDLLAVYNGCASSVKLPAVIGELNREKLNKAMAVTLSDNCKSSLRSIIAIYNIRENLGDLVPKITKYGLFMANVVSAKSPDEIQNVLESTVLPVGSSSIKKNSYRNLSIQSYLGAYSLIGPGPDAAGTWSDRFGVHAPIGIAASVGLVRGGSLSLFTSLLDIGAMVDYKLTQAPPVGSEPAKTEKEYKIELGQIFSPGIYFVYGFPFNIPLSLGVGKQYGPGLSKVESTGTVVENPSWRWNLFLSVDIPFFTLTNRSRNYKK